MGNKDLGLINKWLRNIKDVIRLHRDELNEIKSEDHKFKRLVELNVVEQVYNLHKTSVIQKAYGQNANLQVHGWVYDLREGLIKDLQVDVQKAFEEYGEIYRYEIEPPVKTKLEKVVLHLSGDDKDGRDGKLVTSQDSK